MSETEKGDGDRLATFRGHFRRRNGISRHDCGRYKIWYEGNFEDEKEEYRVGSRVRYRQDNSTHSNVHCCSRIQSQPNLASSPVIDRTHLDALFAVCSERFSDSSSLRDLSWRLHKFVPLPISVDKGRYKSPSENV